MQTIHPCLWFDGRAEEAMNFYMGIFPDARMTDVLRWGDAGPGPKGSVLTCTFELAGQTFMALNGGPQYQFTPAISLVVNCATQAEVDRYWDALLAGGGTPVQCGWITDRFGVSWQIVPEQLPRLLQDKDPARADRAMNAMMQMVKLDIAALERAVAG
ncbi:MAG: VOC family protein [Pseudomonadota bacterium]